MSILCACCRRWLVCCSNGVGELAVLRLMEFQQSEYIVEVIWAVVCYPVVGDAVDGFPCCNGEGWGIFYVLLLLQVFS